MTQLNAYEQSLFVSQGNSLIRIMENKYNICASFVWLTEIYLSSPGNSSQEMNLQDVRAIVQEMEVRLAGLLVKVERARISLNQAVDVLKNKSTYLDSAWNDGYRDEDEFQIMADSFLSYCNNYRVEMIHSIMEV